MNPESIEPDFLNGDDLYLGLYAPFRLYAKLAQESKQICGATAGDSMARDLAAARGQ